MATDWYAFKDQVLADIKAERNKPPAFKQVVARDKPVLSAEPVFDFFEGICPNTNCRGELDVIEVSGILEFLKDHGPDRWTNRTGGEIKSNTWEPYPDGMGDRGVVIMECLACGRAWEVYGVAGDDWAPGF